MCVCVCVCTSNGEHHELLPCEQELLLRPERLDFEIGHVLDGCRAEGIHDVEHLRVWRLGCRVWGLGFRVQGLPYV